MKNIALTSGALASLAGETPVSPHSATSGESGEFSLPQTALAGLANRVQSGKHAAHEKTQESDKTAQLQMLMALLLTPPAAAPEHNEPLSRDRVAAPLLQAMVQRKGQGQGQAEPSPERAVPSKSDGAAASTPASEPVPLPPKLQAAIASLSLSTAPDGATPAQQAKQLELTTQDVRAIAPRTPDRTQGARDTALAAPRVASRIHATDKSSSDRFSPSSLLANTTFVESSEPQDLNTAKPVTTVSVDTRSDDWGEKLTAMLKDSIHFQIGHQQQTSTIRLDPPSLGKLEISIQLDAGKLMVHIGASQADVCRSLQQLSDNLRAQLTQQNFVQVEVQVSADGQSQQQQGNGRDAQQQQQIASALELANDNEQSKQSDSVLIKV